MHQILEHEPIYNRLLLALPRATFARLRPALSHVHLERGQIIDHVDGQIEDLYFLNRGLASLVKTMRDGRSVEIGAIGIDGITDPYALFGIDEAVVETMVQIPGTAFRIKRDVLIYQFQTDTALHEIIQKYRRLNLSQIVQTAACNRLHTLEERCCRWLLIAHDSALSDSFPMTHEFLAIMLGTQRSGVSLAAKALQNKKLISYSRGRMTISNRSGLEKEACECYASIRAERDRLFGVSVRTQ